MAWQQVRDHNGEKREGEGDADPEPSRHIVKLRIVFDDRNRHWLQSHTTDGAIPWLIAHDLRVHGTGILRVCGGRSDFSWLEGHSTLRTDAGTSLVDVRMHRTDEFCHLAIMLLRIILLCVVLLADRSFAL